MMGRKKGGRNMKTAERRIEIVPEWRDTPDVRLLAQALIQIARLRQEAENQSRVASQSAATLPEVSND